VVIIKDSNIQDVVRFDVGSEVDLIMPSIFSMDDEIGADVVITYKVSSINRATGVITIRPLHDE
jgi:hypothetical protein